MNESEQEAVSSLRQCVQELRSSLASNEGVKEQLTNQLDESKRIYNELSEAYDEKVSFAYCFITRFLYKKQVYKKHEA